MLDGVYSIMFITHAYVICICIVYAHTEYKLYLFMNSVLTLQISQ